MDELYLESNLDIPLVDNNDDSTKMKLSQFEEVMN